MVIGPWENYDVKLSNFSSLLKQIFQLEGAATAVDKQLDSNPLKKMFGFFKGNSEKQNEKVEIPTIFNSQTLFSCGPTALNKNTAGLSDSLK